VLNKYYRTNVYNITVMMDQQSVDPFAALLNTAVVQTRAEQYCKQGQARIKTGGKQTQSRVQARFRAGGRGSQEINSPGNNKISVHRITLRNDYRSKSRLR